MINDKATGYHHIIKLIMPFLNACFKPDKDSTNLHTFFSFQITAQPSTYGSPL